MKKKFALILAISLFSIIVLIGCEKKIATTGSVVENETKVEKGDFGAKAALVDTNLTEEKMLKYAIEDEFLARSEYEAIIQKHGEIKPFTNIIKAEEKHISMLKDLYTKYKYKIPEDKSKDHIIIPDNLNDSFKAGVTAEIDNIAMYEKFLKENLPEDIKVVFIELRDGSKSHLSAFEKNVK